MITRETKRKTLEEIAAAFGDMVMLNDDADHGKDRDADKKPESERVEVVVPGRDDD